jgi:hypothetical protein
LLFQDVFDHRKREKVAILQFFDEADAPYIAVIIFRNIPSPLEGLGKESLPDVKMNGFLRHSGMLNQISDFQEFPSPAYEGLRGSRKKDPPVTQPSYSVLKEYY